MEQIELITQNAGSLRLTNLKKSAQQIIHRAQLDKQPHMEFLLEILAAEVAFRKQTDHERRLKLARLPRNNDLDNYDFGVSNGLQKSELNQLRQLLWLEQCYNLILMGPSGVGKSLLAAGLIHDAIKSGYKAYFVTMEELVNVLKMKDVTNTAQNTYNRLLKADIIAIDDIMLFPINKPQAVAFFNLVDRLHEQASIIITTNKSPKEWAKTLDDEVLATALLDRLLYHCEIVRLSGYDNNMDM